MSQAGQVACLGNNQHGELGQGFSSEGVSTPTAVPGVDDAIQIAAGEFSACARRESGRVSCWATRSFEPDRADARVSDISGIGRAVSLSSGGQYFCARDDEGSTLCWGLATWLPCQWLSDDNCQPEHWDVPAPVPGLAGVSGAVELSWDMVRMPDGTIRHVRDTSGGQCEVVAAEGISDAVQIAGHRPLRCARTADGSVFCGCDLPYPPMTLAQVPGLVGVSDISASGSRLCAVLATGQVRCNRFDEPGEACLLAESLGTQLPVVAGVDDAIEVATAPTFSCIRHRTGEVSCWGSGEGGGLGDGTTHDLELPVRIGDLASVVELAASSRYVCARQDSGRVHCWGLILPGREELWSSALDVRFQ